MTSKNTQGLVLPATDTNVRDPDYHRSQPDNTDLNHIPGDDGLPFVGNVLAFYADLYAFSKRQMRRFGPVSRTKLMNQRSLIVIGADLFERILIDREQNFSAAKGYEKSVGLFYKGGLVLRDFDDHRLQRRIMQTAFATRAMMGYIARINELFDQHLSDWAKTGKINFYARIARALMEMGARVLMGIGATNDESRKVMNAFSRINRAFVSLVRREIPGTAFAKAKKSERFLRGWFADMIPLRRTEEWNDVFSHICREKTEDGQYFSDEAIVSHMNFLLFASHETTARTLANLMMYLGGDRNLRQRLREQCLAVGKPYLEYEDLEQVSWLGHVFQETLRLHPIPAILRRTIRECELGGFRVPPHTILTLLPLMTHRDPQFWTNPDVFDPERFSAERAEHQGHRFCYLPFGGGAHRCIGMHFSGMIAKCFLHQLLVRYVFQTPPGYDPKLKWAPFPKAADGVPLIIKPI